MPNNPVKVNISKQNWNLLMKEFNETKQSVGDLTLSLADVTTFNDYSTVLTRDGEGNVIKVELKDGSAVIQTTDITRDSNGNVASIQDVANGKTVTTTINRAADGTVSSVTKAVV
jgi:hypothetical protein